MKKVIMIGLLPIFIFIMPLMMTGSFFLTGCAPDESERFENREIPPGGTLYSESRYPYINQFAGYPTVEDLMNVFYFPQDTMDSLESQGFMEADDSDWFIRMFDWYYEGALVIEEEYKQTQASNRLHEIELFQDALIDMMDIAHYTGFGTVLNELIDQVGADVLTHHAHEIMEHIFHMDDETWESTAYYKLYDWLAKTDAEKKLDEDELQELVDILERMLRGKDVYGRITGTRRYPRTYVKRQRCLWENIG